ncbi:hypothetical protein WA026_015775 [Henosepilachna vigintioctopunctata]|uniref:Uncharacterized protein n=1 Tax=Henosepilachna vigintioctopunctata TaxID=420089 RepID=A0AAW1USY1_9CUCU
MGQDEYIALLEEQIPCGIDSESDDLSEDEEENSDEIVNDVFDINAMELVFAEDLGINFRMKLKHKKICGEVSYCSATLTRCSRPGASILVTHSDYLCTDSRNIIDMDYEKEQARLLKLFEEVESDEDYGGDDDDEQGEIDNIEQRLESSDTEQEFDDDGDDFTPVAVTREPV